MRIPLFLRRNVLSLFTLGAVAVASTRPGELWPDDRSLHVQTHGGGITCDTVDGNYRYLKNVIGPGTRSARLVTAVAA